MEQAKFEQLVRDMRTAQKEYYRFKTNAALSRAKALEAKVDEALVLSRMPELPWEKEGK